MRADFIIRRGGTLYLALDALSGDTSIVQGITASLKRAGPNGTVPSESSPVVRDFIVSARAAAGNDPSGWDLIIANTTELEAGYYIADARISYVSGIIDKTEPVVIEVKPSVS